MAPPSLVEMCVRVAIANINHIQDFGNMPLINGFRDILKAVKNARQLHAIEQSSDDPEIYQETEEHWKRIIKKDFPQLSREHGWTPDKPQNWFKVWDRYNQIKQAADAEAIANLKAAVEANKKKVEMNKATILNANELSQIARPPPKKTGHWSTQPRPKTNSFIQKARNQARQETSRFRLATATGKLPVQPGQIQRAPESMVNQRRIEQQFNPAAAAPAPRIRVPRMRPATSPSEEEIRALVASRERERKEREERLLRIKNSGGKRGLDENSPPRSVVLTFSDDDDDDSGTEAVTKKDTSPTTTKVVSKKDTSSTSTTKAVTKSDSSSPTTKVAKNGTSSPTTKVAKNGTSSPTTKVAKNDTSLSPTTSKVAKKDNQSDDDLDDLFGDDPSPATTPTKGTSLLDVESLEASYKEASGSPKPSSAKKSKGTFSLSEIMTLEAGGKLPTRSPKAPSGPSGSVKAPGGTGSAKSLPGATTTASEIARPSLSTMIKEEAQKIEANLRASVAGPSAAAGAKAGPRRIVKRSRPVDIFMPAKRSRKN